MSRFVILVIILLSPFLSAAPRTQAAEAKRYPVFSNYKEIPGVDRADIEAIEAIKTNRSAIQFGLNYSTEAFLDSDGKIGGFSALFCQWLTELFGLTFKPGIYEWTPMIEGLANKSISMTSDLTATPERRKAYIMTEAVAERSIKYMRLTSREDLEIIALQRQLRFAFFPGTTTHEQVRQNSQQPFDSVMVNDYEEAYNALKTGQADAFFDESCAEAAFDQYPDIMAHDFFPLIYTPVSLATQDPELEPIIRVVQKALDAGIIHHLVELYNRGEQNYRQHRFSSRLTKEELVFLAELAAKNQPIRLAAEYDNYPVSFYNREEKKWQGISFDVLEAITTLSGLKFEIANRSDSEWTDIMEGLENGQYQMVTELIFSKERENRFLWTATPYMVDTYALLSLRETKNFRINEILYLRVGLVSDTAFMELFRDWFPEHSQTVEYINTLDAFEGLEKGEVDLLMATRNLLLSMTNYMEKPEFKTNIIFNYRFNSTFGFNINEKILASIISKSLPMIDTYSIANSWTSRTFDYRGKLARSRVPWLVGCALALVALLVLSIWMLIRRHQINQRLEELVRSRTRELETQRAAALEASRAKGDFLAQMSHEIRTPMNAIIGMAELTLREKLTDEVEEMVHNISQAGNSLLGLINDILDFSKIESGRLELAREPYNFGELLTDVIGVIQPRLAARPIVFFVEIESFFPRNVIGDELRLRQILLNLLTNAVKYTREGSISLKISSVTAGNTAVIGLSVSDTGLGIKPNDLSLLFGNFTRFDNTANKGVEGTGLGLAITRNLARLMGGDITVASEYRKGSTFTAAVTQEIGDYKPLASFDTNPGQILVMENNPSKIKNLSFTLDTLNAQYVLIESPAAMRDELQNSTFACLIAPEEYSEEIDIILNNISKKPRIIYLSERLEHKAKSPAAITLTWPVFCLTLAKALNKHTDGPKKKITKNAFTAPNAQILVVDDIEMNLKVARGLLKPFKANVDTCESGSEAISLVDRKHYDLIFMDHMMPELDGLETTRRIRQLPDGRDVPIVALTANAVSGVREMFIENSMNDFLSKPIDPAKLEATLNQWLPQDKIIPNAN
ncbi:MAG: transporter substrate-binding domain-containing protein [Deltaproteobacteria bacterium]|jgi:signal transduction histidine kinase/CheY-like chemotaxis protein|nr:transporter substrate-binding domain-containing protein [Deltaproteobacteria bacterium]